MLDKSYGNHSCQDCVANSRCPAKAVVSAQYGGEYSTNMCSFYWPPSNRASLPGSKDAYWKQLKAISEGH